MCLDLAVMNIQGEFEHHGPSPTSGNNLTWRLGVAEQARIEQVVTQVG